LTVWAARRDFFRLRGAPGYQAERILMRNIRVAATQFQHTPGDKAANLAVIASMAEQAATQNAEIVVFPECCISGYWHLRHLSRSELTELAEAVPGGASASALGALSRRLGITVGAGLIERTADGRLYNSYVVAMPDGGFQTHRKLHAFVSEHLDCGDRFTVFDTPHGCRVGVLVCYDNNIVENVRINALMGAEILLAPHQTGGCNSGSPHAMGTIDPELWRRRAEAPERIEQELRGDKGRGWLMRWLPARAHDNGLFLVFSNGVGIDDNEVRTGNATVLDPYGRILAETWTAGDSIVLADLDASLRERSTGARWMRARRPELYGLIAQPTGREEPTRQVRFDSPDPT
jgi:predicted amidohydrolase